MNSKEQQTNECLTRMGQHLPVGMGKTPEQRAATLLKDLGYIQRTINKKLGIDDSNTLLGAPR